MFSFLRNSHASFLLDTKNRMGEFVGLAASSGNGDELKTKFAASFGVPTGTYACASLFTAGADAACMWSSGEDVSIEDFQKVR